jgi:phosphohistidine phosphatase
MSQTLRLIMMRHGHSPLMSPSDKLRSLSEVGRAQVQESAHKLTAWPHVWRPQRVFVSAAERTAQTWELLHSSCESLSHHTPHVDICDELYLASAEQWLARLAQLSEIEEAKVVLCIGHNPGLSDLIGQLTGVWTTLGLAEVVGVSIKRQRAWESALAEKWLFEGRVQPKIASH